MKFRMTAFTQGYAVVDIEAVLWVLRPGENMMCIEITTLTITASGTGIVIAGKDGFSPFSVCQAVPEVFIFRCDATLPMGMSLTTSSMLNSTLSQVSQLLRCKGFA